MKNILHTAKLLGFIIALLISNIVLASAPVFTFTPLTPTTISLYNTDTARVQYLVQNQSSKSHTIVMVPIAGITQVAGAGNCPNPFILGKKQSCQLVLSVNGSQLSGNIHGGPVLCQQGPDGKPNPLLCYQPSAPNVLNITVGPLPRYTITSSAGPNGTLSSSGSQIVTLGASTLFTATPNTNYIVYQWLVDGVVAQTGGITFLLSNITTNHTVQVTFTNTSLFYSGTQNGSVYYSFTGGSTWMATPLMPASGSAINSIFATTNTLYVGTADGLVHYSLNNGSSWSATSSPDGSIVNSVFVINNTLYAATANGSVYYSTNNGNTWHLTSQPDGSSVNSIFVTGTALYAGTALGNVYLSVDNGLTWIAIDGQPDGSAIQSVFLSNGKVYASTANEFAYSSPALSGGGTWTTFAQTVYSLFINPTNNNQYAGTEGGYVYSITAGAELGFVTYSPINSVYVLN